MSCHDGVTNDSSGGDHEISGNVTNGLNGYVDTSVGHPISFSYADANSHADYQDDPQIKDNVQAKLDQGNVECSTCHDIHGSNPNSVDGNFAIRNANASVSTNPTEAICLSCHIR